MPLQLQDLDDRRYTDLVAEALARIPAHAPEWTNHNPSDPGITLIELFAYLTDMLLYRLNRVTDDNTRKFLKLLNPAWIEPQNADLREETRKVVLGVRELYRAVTKDDYELLSTEKFNQWLIDELQTSIHLVARAHCVPQKNLTAGTEAARQQRRPEHVSVVIVPARETPNPHPPPRTVIAPDISFDASNPQPSDPQIRALFSFLDERRMLTTKLHVVGPFYAHVSAQLVIACSPDTRIAELAIAVRASLAELLNLLPTAGRDGWPFGRDVFVSDVYETLEKIRGIDFITDVMLDSSCAADDDKCVIADRIWHAEGDLVGLSIQDHHLPVFDEDQTDIVITPNTAFISLNLSISANAQTDADPELLKREIKATVRDSFHPSLGGLGPTTGEPTKIFVSDLQVAIKNIKGLLDPVSVACTPSGVAQNDPDRGLFIYVDAGQIVDWRVTIKLN